MNKKEQIEFIKDNYPATTHHISKRRVRHNFFSSIKTELQAYLLGFILLMEVLMKNVKHLEQNCKKEILKQYIYLKIVSQKMLDYIKLKKETLWDLEEK